MAYTPLKREIHVSEINSYLTCRRRHDYQYNKLIPYEANDRMNFGTVVHAGLEGALIAKHNKIGDPLEVGSEYALEKSHHLLAAFNKDDEEGYTQLSAALADARSVAARAIKWLDVDRWETLVIDGVPAIEISLSLPIKTRTRTKLMFGCTQDWVCRDTSNGQCWSFEFKTRKQLTTESLGEVSLQQAAYQYVLHQKGFPIEGAMEFCILAAVPKWPKLNKDGTMSRAACATDWQTYESALLANNLNPDHYSDMRAQLEFKEWFRLVPQYRTIDECERTWNQVVVPIAKEIVSRDRPVVVPVLAKHTCRACSFLERCMEELRGYHISFELEVNDDE